ncbi:MAG: ABC transporter transmembrane domain-containing protein, partial [Acidimicrobiia bacterium]|nr:ABC transporter transmembrane domain-containing protein [Acidimicrobiia bacterium]
MSDKKITTAAQPQGPTEPTGEDAPPGTIGRLVGRMIGGPQKWRATVAALLLLIALVGLVTIPYATGRGMNVITEMGSKDDLADFVLLGFVAAVVYLFFSYIANRMFAKLASEALYGVQTDLFDNVQTLSMAFFFKNPPGELSSNVTNDAETVSLFYTTAVSQILRSTLQVVLILVVMFVVNWQLALVAVLTIPLLVLVAYVVAQVGAPAFNRLQEALGDVSAFQEETLSGHKVIISKNRRPWAEEQHEEQVAEVYQVGKKAFMASLMQFPATQALSLIQNVLVLIAG